ncbi:hypothetical protein Ppb6_00307 [Photorhabdus australis subsp. thailandensis]|uniref:Oligosaccharide repeat unit polymerase n=1 Tax=Photorhabdus australis subsp. thailandensis TaxID=2805096 RepID=A0A1C0U952_9GAMM|nr:hypothetical protein Ppb6_00307 [Photorhabdus australis subsp. thailandensis]
MRDKNYRTLWLFIYILINIVSTIIILSSDKLMGDVDGKKSHDSGLIIISSLSIITSYIIILYFIFELYLKIKIKPLYPFLAHPNNSKYISNKIGFLIFVLQVFFLIYSIYNGHNSSEVNIENNKNIWRIFWIFIPIDMLVFIYYGYFRGSKYFRLNIFLWLISNIIRGWSGPLLIIIFMEGLNYYKKKNFSIIKSLFIILLIILLYPFIFILKMNFRLTTEDILSIYFFHDFISSLTINNYFTIVYEGFYNLIGRIQLISMLSEIIRYSGYIEHAMESDQFRSFWADGLHGIIYDHLVYGFKRDNIGTYITTTDIFSHFKTDRQWNTNISYPAWFFISPVLSIYYIIFTLSLLWLSMFLVKKINLTYDAKNILWLSWLIYVMPPWWGTFTTYCYALFLFLLLLAIIRKLSTIVL